MRLTGVTITGADDGVRIDELLALAERYPFVEWGVLFSRSRQGIDPRYPGEQWVSELGWRKPPGRWAAHLCGERARATLEGDEWFIRHWPGHFGRIQLNGFSERLPGPGLLHLVRTNPAVEFILQATGPASLAMAEGWATAAGCPNVSALYDPSGGRGLALGTIVPATWRLPTGYAGGIGPGNVVSVVNNLGAQLGQAPFWIDM